MAVARRRASSFLDGLAGLAGQTGAARVPLTRVGGRRQHRDDERRDDCCDQESPHGTPFVGPVIPPYVQCVRVGSRIVEEAWGPGYPEREWRAIRLASTIAGRRAPPTP